MCVTFHQSAATAALARRQQDFVGSQFPNGSLKDAVPARGVAISLEPIAFQPAVGDPVRASTRPSAGRYRMESVPRGLVAGRASQHRLGAAADLFGSGRRARVGCRGQSGPLPEVLHRHTALAHQFVLVAADLHEGGGEPSLRMGAACCCARSEKPAGIRALHNLAICLYVSELLQLPFTLVG